MRRRRQKPLAVLAKIAVAVVAFGMMLHVAQSSVLSAGDGINNGHHGSITRTSVFAAAGGAERYIVKDGLARRAHGTIRVKAGAVRKELGTIRPARSEWIGSYNRDAFGEAWADTDRNGCDQRNDVLRRDLRHLDIDTSTSTQGCIVFSGVLRDRYTGKTIHFQRGETSSVAVQIDHMVPLSWAWRSGASGWSNKKRERFANDFANLTAVDGPTNEAKSDSGPAEWMPPQRSYRCVYVARFTGVVARYNLTMDTDDRNKIAAVLARC